MGNSAGETAERLEEVRQGAAWEPGERSREAPLVEQYEDDGDYADFEDDFDDIYDDEDVDGVEDTRQNLDLMHSHEQGSVLGTGQDNAENGAVMDEMGQRVGYDDVDGHTPQVGAPGVSDEAIVHEDGMADTTLEGSMQPISSHANMVASADDCGKESVADKARKTDERLASQGKLKSASKNQRKTSSKDAGASGALEDGHGESADRPMRSRRGQSSPTKRWSSSLGVWVDVPDARVKNDGDQVSSSSKRVRANSRGRHEGLTRIGEPGSRSSRGGVADGAAARNMDRGGKAIGVQAIAQGGEFVNSSSARINPRQGDKKRTDRRGQASSAQASLLSLSTLSFSGSGNTIDQGSQADGADVGQEGAKRPQRQPAASRRWSSTSGQWVPAGPSASPSKELTNLELSSPDKLQTVPENPSQTQTSPKARTAGVASEAPLKAEEGSTMGRKRKTRAEVTVASPDPSPVKVEDAGALGGYDEDDGEVVMRHRASIGPSPSKSDQSRVSLSFLSSCVRAV